MSHQKSSDSIQFEEFSSININLNQHILSGKILDIGGGGEGVIGQWLPKQVIAVDTYYEELTEAAHGPIKIVMDANDLSFLNNTFDHCTLFYTLMYMNAPTQEKTIQEIFRTLNPGGTCTVWDVNFPKIHNPKKEYYTVQLKISIHKTLIQTGYGVNKPDWGCDTEYYKSLFQKHGFENIQFDDSKSDHLFLAFRKPFTKKQFSV